MKSLKILTFAMLVAFSFNAFANDEPKVNKLSMDYALKTYIDAMTEGRIKGFSEILDSDVKFTISRGEKIINYNKSEIIDLLRSSENVKQNCKTEYVIMEQTPMQAVIKVIMKYDDFSRINFLTFANTNKGWKITNVSSSFS